MLSEVLDANLDLAAAELPREYFYQSLPLCVLDAVFSIGIRYTQVENLVNRYCRHFGLRVYRDHGTPYPIAQEQEPVSKFISRVESLGSQAFAQTVLENRTRTSAVNGILKADAALRFAHVLRQFAVECFQDVASVMKDDSFARAIKAIPGQGSGLSLSYFQMLCGDEDLAKPDRHVLAFLAEQLGYAATPQDAQALLEEATAKLRQRYPALTLRKLDHAIWNYQRGRR